MVKSPDLRIFYPAHSPKSKGADSQGTSPATPFITYTGYLDALENDDFDSIFAGVKYFKK